MDEYYDPADSPLLFHAHPLLAKTMLLLHHPNAYPTRVWLGLFAIYVIAEIPGAVVLKVLVKQATGARISWTEAALWGFPILIIYLPLVTTLVDDVVRQAFELQHRWLFLLSLFTIVQVVAVGIAWMTRSYRSRVINWQGGFTVSLGMLIFSSTLSTLILVIDHLVDIV